MLTKKNRVAFKLLLAVVCAGFLAGCKPPGPKALLDGKRLLEKGKFTEAIERLKVATAPDMLGTNAQAWNYLGVACHQAGQASNAVVAYQRALALDPDLLEVQLNLGTLWLELGQAGEAKSRFTAYTLRRENDPIGFRQLAKAELRLRETSQAEQHARTALRLDDKDPDAWNTLGLIQLQRGRSREAVQSFLGALQRDANYPPTILNLAILSQQFGDRATALKWYQKYLGLKPRPADADAVIGVVRQLQQEMATARAAPAVAAPVATEPAPAAPEPAPTNLASIRPSPTPTSVPTSTPAPAPKPEPVHQSKPVVAVQPPVHPPPTVVTLPPEPEIRTEPVVQPPTTSPLPPAARPAREVASQPALASAEPKEEKRGFLPSINPINLFRHEPRELRVTPLPDSDVALKSEPASAPAATPAPPAVGVASTPATPADQPVATVVDGGTRYTYRGGGRTTEGDRAAAQQYAGQGLRAMQAKQYGEANTAFRSAAAADPSWFQAHFNHAVAALQAGRIAESLAASETALALQPDSTEARYNFALTLKRGGYFVDAAAELERRLKASPEDVRAHLTLGNLYAEQLHQTELARTHYLKVIALDPRHPKAGAINFWLAANPRK